MPNWKKIRRKADHGWGLHKLDKNHKKATPKRTPKKREPMP